MGGLFIDGESVTLRDQGTIFSLDITSLNGPEMAVEVPAGTNLISGSSTVNYGTVANGVAAPKTFTIKNWGTSALSVSSVTVSGGNASDFSVKYDVCPAPSLLADRPPSPSASRLQRWVHAPPR